MERSRMAAARRTWEAALARPPARPAIAQKQEPLVSPTVGGRPESVGRRHGHGRIGQASLSGPDDKMKSQQVP